MLALAGVTAAVACAVATLSTGVGNAVFGWPKLSRPKTPNCLTPWLCTAAPCLQYELGTFAQTFSCAYKSVQVGGIRKGMKYEGVGGRQLEGIAVWIMPKDGRKTGWRRHVGGPK